jgi:hypothetical protein
MLQPHFGASVRMGLALPKVGTWESIETPETSEFNCKGQNTLHCDVIYIIGKLLKCKCWKWVRMNHLDICSTSYGKKKGWESNWQFDSRPLKVGNWSDPNACKWSATHRWKTLDESYKFSWNFIPIRGPSKELWTRKMARVQTGTVSRLLVKSPEIKSHSDVGATMRRKEYYMGEGGGFPRVQAVVSQMNPCCPWLVPTP